MHFTDRTRHETTQELDLVTQVSDGCQIGVRLVSDWCQIGIRLVSDGCQMGVRWVSDRCQTDEITPALVISSLTSPTDI